MYPRIEAFNQNLCLEHLEEASFLYDQRVALTWDLEFTWPEQATLEEKFEAHLDALCSLAHIATDVLRESAAPTDSGELFTAVSFHCRQDSVHDVVDLVPHVDYEEGSVTDALVGALLQRAPDAWADALAECAADHDDFLPLFLEVAARRGWRRHGDPGPLRARDQWAAYAGVTRLTNPQAAAPECFQAFQQQNDFDTRFACALTLMRAAHPPFLEAVTAQHQPDDVNLLALALMGSHEMQPFLAQVPQAETPSRAYFLALSLLGDPRACPYLLGHLEAESEWAAEAAMALNLICGGFYTETVWIEEDPDEDELFDDEKDDEDDDDDEDEVFERLVAVAEDDEDDDDEDEDEDDDEEEDDPDEDLNQEPQGEEIERLSQNPKVWRQHLEQLSFEQGLRYRYGTPTTVTTVVGSLFEPRTPNFMRDLILHECLIRYNLEIPMTVLTPIAQQNAIGRALLSELEGQGESLPPGTWTYLNNPYS